MSRAAAVRRSVATALLLAGTTTFAACGSSAGAAPDSADADCRTQWSQLARSIDGHTPDTRAHSDPSMLADRWNAVAAGVQYYVTSATAKDCGDTLSNQRLSIDALIDFGNGLQAFDMEYQRDQLTGPAQAILDGPAPQGKQTVTKQAVREALQILSGEAETASADLQPGWAEANTVDLSDRAAVEQTLSDLTLLGEHSAAYQQCQAATKTIRTAIDELIS